MELRHNSAAADGDPVPETSHLTRREVMKRRASRLRRLARCYRDHYWLLMEDVRRRRRDYVWMYAKEGGGEGEGVADAENDGKLSFKECSFPNCKSKAMALTNYCYPHILSDSKQVLYTPCRFALKCSDDPILCGKPVLKSTVPSICLNHMKHYELYNRRALKKNGATVGVSNKLASKFHLVLTEYVRLIKNRRRARRRVDNLATDDKTT